MTQKVNVALCVLCAADLENFEEVDFSEKFFGVVPVCLHAEQHAHTFHRLDHTRRWIGHGLDL